MGTRFLATEESSATEDYKQAVIRAREEDIVVAHRPGSPCGLPFRVIKQSPMYQSSLRRLRKPKCDKGYVLMKDAEGKFTVCPAKEDNENYFCICNGLLSSGGYNTNEEEALYTVGSNAARVDKIVPVQTLMKELTGAQIVMSEADASVQLEMDSGKRVKVKLANVLLRFEQPAPAEFLARAGALAQEIDLDLAWEFSPEGEFGFADLARDYFNAQAGPEQQAAALLRLFDAPHYFRRQGKGMFRKAPAETVKAALLAIERKKQQAEQIAQWAEVGQCANAQPERPGPQQLPEGVPDVSPHWSGDADREQGQAEEEAGRQRGEGAESAPGVGGHTATGVRVTRRSWNRGSTG